MIFSLDVDNVLRNHIGSIIRAVWLKFEVKLKLGDFDKWDPDLGHKVGMPNKDFTAWVWTDPIICASGRPVKGVDKALNHLFEQHTIVTNSATANPHLTQPWLNYHNLPHHQVYHLEKKWDISFDLHVDDSPHLLQHMYDMGLPVCRFSLPLNDHLIHIPSISGWHEYKKLIDIADSYR